MHYLLLALAAIAFAFLAPPKVTLAAALFLLAMMFVTRFVARMVSGIEHSYGDAIKAVGLSLFFLFGAACWLLSFSKGTGISQFDGFAALAVNAGFFTAYVLGFQLCLRLTFSASAVVAVMSSVVSALLVLAVHSVGGFA
jgi:hypothetical protein